ncbi:apolipoprotein N-acyltransferase [Desulfococcus sp.]|uniref:apolipoprotein N-acyltransferase n=1 Tax=Desulfococcus sp. TaxID=2025834 RepID=UPI003D1522FB
METLNRYFVERTDDLLAAGAGLLLTAAYPDVDLDWIAWAALVPLLTALKGASVRTAFRRGMVTGMVHYLTLIYWLVHTMRTYGGLPWYLAVPPLFLLSAYLSLYIGVFAAALARIPGVAPAMAAAPMLWTGLEYLRASLLSGFPWELLGYSQYRHLHLIQISDISGVYGVSFLVVMGNAVLFLSFAALTRRPWQGRPIRGRHVLSGLAAVLTAVVGVWGYGVFRLQATGQAVAAAPTLRAAVVQGNIDQMIKWDPAFQEQTVEKYLILSRSITPKADLVVWPETAVPFYFLNEPKLTERVVRGVRESGAYYVIGSPAFEQINGDIAYYNSAYLISPDGRPTGRYDKVHLVPFGEYVPLRQWLPFVRKLVAHVGDFKTGEMGKTLVVEGAGRLFPAADRSDIRIGILICYEIIFSDLARAAAKNDAGILVNVTNDAWYGRSSAPYQHFSMAVFRAVENRRALIRSANTGISGFVDPTGRIGGMTPLFVDAVLAQNLPVLSEKTVYTRTGDWFAATCLGITLITIMREIFRRKKHER